MLYLITLHNVEDREQFNLDMSSHTCRTPSIGKSSVIYDISEEFAQTLYEDERVKEVEIEEACSGSSWSRTSSNWAKSDTQDSDHDNWGIFRSVTGTSPETWGVDGTENTSGTAAIDENGTGVRFLVWDGHPIDHPEYSGQLQGGHGFAPQTIALRFTTDLTGGVYTYEVDSVEDFEEGITTADRFANHFEVKNPTINIFKGDTLKIKVPTTSTDQKLYFKTSPGTGSGNQVTGATGQGAMNNSYIEWTPTITGTFYYNAFGTSNMAGTIVVHQNNRMRRPNWFAYTAGAIKSGGTYSYGGTIGDNTAHGTATAGLVAGYRQGWGIDSSIYSMDPFGTDPGYGNTTWSNMTNTEKTRDLQIFARNWMLRNTTLVDEEGGDFKFAAGRSVDLAEETNPIVKVMPVFSTYVSPITLYDGPETNKVFCRKRDIYTLDYRNGATTYGFSDTITTQNLTDVKCSTYTPRSAFRATANIASGDTSFTGFIGDIEYQAFMEGGFTGGGAWTYAASHQTMAGRTITGATDTGNTIDYYGTTYKLFTFSLDAGASASQAASESTPYGFTFDYNEEVVRPPAFQNSVLSDGITELLDKGMHIVASAGNTNQYHARMLDEDWNNYFRVSSTGTKYYYNRPEWFKHDNRVLVVGAVDNTTTEQKTTYSNKGPRVDLYAPAQNCQAATSNYYSTKVTYPDNNSYYMRLHNGTSAAAPQVAGLLGAGLSRYPHVTPLQGREWIIGESDRDRLEIPIGDTGKVDSPRNPMGNNRYLRYGNPLSFVSKAFYPKDTNLSRTWIWFASVINDDKLKVFDKVHVAKNSDIYLNVRASDDTQYNSLLTPNNYTFTTSGGVRVFDVTGTTQNPTISANAASNQTFRLNYANCAAGADTSVTITLTHNKHQTTGTAYKKWTFNARVGDHQNFSVSSGYGVQVWKKGEELYPRLDTSDDQIFYHSHYAGITSSSTVDFQNIDDDFDIINGDWFIDPRIDDNFIWEQVGVGHLRLHIGTWTGSIADPSPGSVRYWVTIFRKDP